MDFLHAIGVKILAMLSGIVLLFSGAGAHTVNYTASDAQAAAVGATQEVGQTSSGTTSTPTSSGTATTTVVNNYITQPVIERTVQTATTPSGSGYVTQDAFTTAINELSDRFGRIISGSTYPAPASNLGTGGVWNAIAATNKIDQLTGTKLTNISVNGVSGLTTSDIPSLSGSYLSLTGGTVTGTTTLATTTVADIITTNGPQIDVRAYGAKGDGVTDDTAAIQAALSAASVGATVFLPPTTNYYKVAGQISVTKAVTIMGQNSQVNETTSNVTLFYITASNVRITGLNLQGPQSATYHSLENAIVAAGTFNAGLAPTNITNIVIEKNTINNWGAYGIRLEYVTNFTIDNNKISNIVYSAVSGLSGVYGTIKGNNIDTVKGGNAGSPAGNAYGISVSRYTSDSGDLVSQPRSSDISITGNTIANVPTWEGVDTHCGQRIAIVGNTVYNAYFGPIAVGSCKNSGGVYTYAPLDVTVSGNVVQSNLTDGSNGYGIIFQGVAGVGGERATGNITGNTVENYGDQTNSSSGALYIFGTQGLSITGNTILNPSPIGIQLYNYNVDFTATGNTIVDPWSNTTAARGVDMSAGNNSGTISGNTISRGSKVATYTIDSSNGVGLFVYASTNAVTLGANRSAATTYIYDPYNVVTTRLSRTGIGTSTPYSLLTLWGADTGTGQLFEAVNSASTTLMRLLDNGTAYFSGNVGIGTTTPADKLDVFGNIISSFNNGGDDNNGVFLRNYNSNGYGGSFNIQGSGGGAGLYTYSRLYSENMSGGGGFLALQTANTSKVLTTRMFLDNSGHVGIGTTSPQSALAVSGGASVGADYNIAAPANGLIVEGNVGIGTSSPSALLHVYGAGPAILSEDVNSTTGIAQVQITARGKAGGYGSGISFQSKETGTNTYLSQATIEAEGYGNWTSVVTASSFLRFSTINTGTLAEQMRITNTGNVGIGTANPQAKLDVQGTASSTNVYSAGGLIANGIYTPSYSDGLVADYSSGQGRLSVGASDGFGFYNGGVANTALMTILSSGNVGIGTTSPTARLDVAGGNNGTNPLFMLSSVASFATTTRLIVTNAGQLGIGAATPGNQLVVRSAAASNSGIVVSNTNSSGTMNLLFNYNSGDDVSSSNLGRIWATAAGNDFFIGTGQSGNPGANIIFKSSVASAGSYDTELMRIQRNGNVGIGTTSPDMLLSVGSATPVGNVAHFENSTGSCYINPTTGVSCSSDSRLKTNVNSLTATSGISALMQLNPVTYNWTAEATGTPAHSGFIAQQVQPILPDLVSQGPDGYYTLNYAGFVPYLVKSVQEIATISGAFKDALVAWLGDAANGIHQFFADIGNFHTVNSDTVNTHTLCIKKSDGTNVCITGDQLAAAVSGQASTGGGASGASSGSATADTGASSTPPTIELIGNNPATVNVGDTYSDLGAKIIGPAADLNLGIHAFVGTTPIEQAVIDTSAPATYHLYYVATDQNGLTATSTRTVIVQATTSTSSTSNSTSTSSTTATASTTTADASTTSQ